MIYDSIEYGFANKIDENDESLNIYKLVYNENGISKVLEDEKIINILLPLFEKLITKEINEDLLLKLVATNGDGIVFKNVDEETTNRVLPVLLSKYQKKIERFLSIFFLICVKLFFLYVNFNL